MKNELLHIKSLNILDDARKIIEFSRSNAVKSVDFLQSTDVLEFGKANFWRRTAEKRKSGLWKLSDKKLAEKLESEYGCGFNKRLLLSNNKEAVMAVARKERIPESPKEILKDPMILEFLGLERKAEYFEKDFESAIISHITDFLLEMGKGFFFLLPDRNEFW